jgi:glycolate oxidase FAD binding subunit
VEALGRLMLALLHAQLSTVAIQLRGGADGFDLDIQLASLPEVLETQTGALEKLSQGEGLVFRESTEEVWGARQQVLNSDLVCKGTMLPTEVARFAARVRGLGGESVTQGTGIMFAGFSVGAGEGIVQLRREMEEGGGSLMVLKQTAEMGMDCWGTLPDSVTLMREVKRQFDPEKILNPGRFLGKI